MEHIVQPIKGIQPEPRASEVQPMDKFTQPEIRPESPWSDTQIRSRHVQNAFGEGQPVGDNDLFRVAVDIFGLEPDDVGPRNTKMLQELIELVKEKFRDNPTEILKFLQRGARELSGTNKHKQLLRQLQISGFNSIESPEGKWELMREEYKMLQEKVDAIDKKISERKANKKIYG